MDEFSFGNPAIVCRWRLSNGRLPMESRHFRALAARRFGQGTVSPALVAWAKQHIEWTLHDGSASHPNGVLMLVIDQDGKAAMTVGEYVPLARTSANDLLQRAKGSFVEARATGVSPEDLWAVRKDALVWATSSEFRASATSSLIDDLARTLGMAVRRDDDYLSTGERRGFGEDEVFLVSDEHGVVPASDRSGERARKFAASYAKLLKRK